MSQLSREAAQILITFTPETDRTLIVWAIGAHQGEHALTVCQLLGGMFETNSGGSTLSAPSYRYLDYNSREVWIGDMPHTWEGPRLITVTWREVAKALRVADSLVAGMKAALAERKALSTEYYAASYNRLRRTVPLTPDEIAAREAHSKAHAVIENRCELLGAAAWEGCRPPAEHEPADLLELLAAMAGAA